ncbi:MAG: extracellular solute-binding protein [Oscillospiraceae bacterium]
MQAAASGLSVTVIYPREGAVVQPDCAAIIADCAHEDNARAFIDFLLSGEVQERLTRQYRRTVFTPRATPPCPTRWPTIPTPQGPIRRRRWTSGAA